MVAAYTGLAQDYYAEYDKARAILLHYEEMIKNPEKAVRDFLNKQLEELFKKLKKGK